MNLCILIVFMISFFLAGFSQLAPPSSFQHRESLTLTQITQRAVVRTQEGVFYLRQDADGAVTYARVEGAGLEWHSLPVKGLGLYGCYVQKTREGSLEITGPKTLSVGVDVPAPQDKPEDKLVETFYPAGVGVFQLGNHDPNEKGMSEEDKSKSKNKLSEDAVAVSADGHILVVADGVGGSGVGKTKQLKRFTEALVHAFVAYVQEDPFSSLRDIFVKKYPAFVNNFNQKNKDIAPGSLSTTLVLVRVREGKAEVLNIGDSAVLIFDKDGGLAEQTLDLSADLNKPLQVSNEEGLTEEDCLRWVHEGASLYESFKKQVPSLSLEAYDKSHNLCEALFDVPQEGFVVATSDAMKDNLYPSQMEAVMKKQISAQAKAQELGLLTYELAHDAQSAQNTYKVAPFYLEKGGGFFGVYPRSWAKQFQELLKSTESIELVHFLFESHLLSLGHSITLNPRYFRENMEVSQAGKEEILATFRNVYKFNNKEMESLTGTLELMEMQSGFVREALGKAKTHLEDWDEEDMAVLLARNQEAQVDKDISFYSEECLKSYLQRVNEYIDEHRKVVYEDVYKDGIAYLDPAVAELADAVLREFPLVNYKLSQEEVRAGGDATQKNETKWRLALDINSADRIDDGSLLYSMDPIMHVRAFLKQDESLALRFTSSLQDRLFKTPKNAWTYAVPLVPVQEMIDVLTRKFDDKGEMARKTLKALWDITYVTEAAYREDWDKRHSWGGFKPLKVGDIQGALAKPDDITVALVRPHAQRQHAFYDLSGGRELMLSVGGEQFVVGMAPSSAGGRSMYIQNKNDRTERVGVESLAADFAGKLSKEQHKILMDAGVRGRVKGELLELSYDAGSKVRIREGWEVDLFIEIIAEDREPQIIHQSIPSGMSGVFLQSVMEQCDIAINGNAYANNDLEKFLFSEDTFVTLTIKKDRKTFDEKPLYSA